MSETERPRGPETDRHNPNSLEFARLHIWQVQAFRDLLVVAVVLGVVWAGYAMRFVTVPLLLAFALAYLVEPLVGWLCRVLRFTRPAAVGAIMAAFGVAILVALLLLVPAIVRQTSQFMDSLRSGQFNSWMDRGQKVLPAEWQGDISKYREWLAQKGIAPAAESPSTVDSTVASGSQPTPPVPAALHETGPLRPVEPDAVASVDSSLIASLFGPNTRLALGKLVDFSALAFAAILIPFYFWFFSIGFPGALRFLEGLIPNTRRETIVRMAKEMDAAVAGFVRGRILIAGGMGVMFAVGWSINQVPYALTLGLLAGFLSIVPYLGVVVTIPAIAVLAVSQLSLPEAQRMAWYWIVGGPPLVYVIVQSIEGYILTPVFAGRATNLGPVSIFVAVLAGASVAGVYGMLLAIPVAACAKILIRETVMPSLRSWTQGESSDPLPLDRE